MAQPSSSWWPSLYYPNSAQSPEESSKSLSPDMLNSNNSHTSPPNAESASSDANISPENSLLKSQSHPPEPNRQDTQSLLGSYIWGKQLNENANTSDAQISKDSKLPDVEADISSFPQPSSWWWSHLSIKKSSGSLNDSATAVPQVPHKEESPWFSWLWPTSEVANDSNLDPSAQRMKRLLSEAQAAIESPKGAFHYAICEVVGRDLHHLAVEGTQTESQPVAFDVSNKPISPNESFEWAISYAKQQQETKSSKSSVQTNAAQTQKTSSILQNEVVKQSSNPKVDKGSGAAHGNGNTSTEPQTKGCSQTKDVSSHSRLSASELLHKTEESSFSSVLPTILPELNQNLRRVTLITKARLWGESILYGEKTSEKHIYKSSSKSVTKKKSSLTRKVVIISTHSFLPIKFVKSFIGQGTGNACQFSISGAEAIKRWIRDSSSDPTFGDFNTNTSIFHTISLEGMGTIKDRVNSSFKLIQNWSSEIRNSDCVLFLSNSMACPVSAFLIKEMFEHSAYKMRDKKVGVLNMAGVHTGIFPDIDSKTVRRAYTADENNILREVFELQSETSDISKDLANCWIQLCSLNVKSTFCGGVNDQFVPLYSASANKIKHPNIYKCLYVCTENEVPAFITRLLSIILTMENVGHYHELLLNELSVLLQGPTTAVGSHGSILQSSEVYDTAIQFAFETTSLRHSKPPLVTATRPLGNTSRNLYNFPWIVRGLINELIHIKNVHSRSLIRNLIIEYGRWKPISRQWRDVKNCFAAFEEVCLDDIFI